MNVLSAVGLAPEERRNALLLIGSNFFEGLAIALFYSVALTLFLNNNPISMYGWLLVASGGFVLLFTPIYQRIEHILKTNRLFMFLAILTLLVFAAGYVVTGFEHSLSAAGVGFALMILYHFIYVLYKIRFWGLSALFFDVRQSKRVFGLIGSVNLPAKFLGFTLVTTLNLLSDVGFENLLLAGVVSYLGSATFMYFIITENPKTLHLDHAENKYTGKHARSIVKGIMLLSAVVVFALTFINFLFAKEVQHHFEVTDGNMFQLISEALAISYGLATVVKIIVSGKVLGRFKLKALLTITPILIALAVLGHWVIRSSTHIEEQEYLFFVMLMIVSLMLTEAIDSPLVMSLFQPLSKREILSGHTLVKGYAESFGVILVGFSLVYFYHGHSHINLEYAIPIVFASAILWLFIGRRFATKYLYHLRHLIELKLIKGDQVLFLDQDTEIHLKRQLGSDEDRVVSHALEILVANDRIEGRHIKRLLDSKRVGVRELALSTLESEQLMNEQIEEKLKTMLTTSSEPEKCHVLTVLSSNLEGEDLAPFLKMEGVEAQYAVAMGLTKNSENNSSWIKQLIETWMKSDEADLKLKALSIISEFVHPSNVVHLKSSLLHSSSVREKAIKVAAKYLSDLSSDLIANLGDRKMYRRVIDAFQNAPFELLHSHKKELENQPEARVDLLLVSKTDLAAKELVSLLEVEDPKIRRTILRGLIQFEDVVIDKQNLSRQLKIEKQLLEKLNFSVPRDELINNALKLERNEIVERMLGYCFLNSREMVLLNAQKELFLDGENKLALCIEALQASLPMSLFNPIRKVLESRVSPKMDVSGASIYQLYEVRNQLGRWLTLLIRDQWTSNEVKQTNDKKRIMKENKVQRIERVLMLRQTALFEEIHDNRLLDIADLLNEATYAEGDTIFEKGDQGDSLFIITKGEVAIIDGRHELVRFGHGDFFGDLSLLDPAPRSASAKAVAETQLLYLDQAAIYEMMFDHIEVVKGILGALCKRIRNQNKVYIEEKNKVSEQI